MRELISGALLLSLTFAGAAAQTGQPPMSAILLPPQKTDAVPELTDAANGVTFDLNGDGTKEQVGWPAQLSGLRFLALDRNNNGRIDDGKELYGSKTTPGQTNGFAALIKDAESVELGIGRRSARLDADNPLYQKLLLWDDVNHNGLSEPGEVSRFSDHYVGFTLSYDDDHSFDLHGNQLRFRGYATIRVGESNAYPSAPVVCDAYKCWSDVSEDQARLITAFEVSFVTR